MVKFAVLGCGRISAVHLDAVDKAKNAYLAAVCDINEEKAKKKSSRYNVPYYTDLETMLTSVKPDVVIIGTPSGMHGEHAKICARHGVNVLCEKPLEITKQKLDDMIDVCQKCGVKLGGIFQRRTYTGALITKDAIDSNKLGKLILCDGYFKYSRTQEYYDSDAWRGTWELDGGGALMNQCIHGIDMLIMLCGDIESVNAKCETKARNIDVEDTAVIIVKFKNGAIGVIEGTTSLVSGNETIFNINGTLGSITFGDSEIKEWIVNGGTKPKAYSDTLGGKNCAWQSVSDGHRLLVENMADAVLFNTPVLIPPNEARKAVDVILAIYKSAKLNKEVEV